MATAEERLAQRLDELTRALSASVSEADQAVVRRYQGLDRTYALVNGLLRGEVQQGSLSYDGTRLVAEVVTTLDRLIGRWKLPEAAVVYRGVRDSTHVVGANAPGDRVAEGLTLESKGYVSTSVHREVALAQFTVPPRPSGAAMFEVVVPAGTPALWVPPVGAAELKAQGELLLARGTKLAVGASRRDHGILMVTCEVDR